MQRHSENGLAVAQFLAEHPLVSWVSYPGLASHPSHAPGEKIPARRLQRHDRFRGAAAAWKQARNSSATSNLPRTWRTSETPKRWLFTPPAPPTSNSPQRSSWPAASLPTSSASPWASKTRRTSSPTSSRRWRPPGRWCCRGEHGRHGHTDKHGQTRTNTDLHGLTRIINDRGPCKSVLVRVSVSVREPTLHICPTHAKDNKGVA